MLMLLARNIFARNRSLWADKIPNRNRNIKRNIKNSFQTRVKNIKERNESETSFSAAVAL